LFLLFGIFFSGHVAASLSGGKTLEVVPVRPGMARFNLGQVDVHNDFAVRNFQRHVDYADNSTVAVFVDYADPDLFPKNKVG
jgi:hypothetical protein